MPRAQAGPQPQRLLITLLGGYWFGRAEHLPSRALVSVMEYFGITGPSTRAALSRLKRRGLLISSNKGRNTYYGLSERASSILAEGVPRILQFGATEVRWDGRWTLFAFSVPEKRRHIRPALRSSLRWAGFAPLYDGLWVSPRGRIDDLRIMVEELSVDAFTVVTGSEPEFELSGWPLIRAFDLEGLRVQYEAFIAEFGPLRDRAHRGGVPLTEALTERTRLIEQWTRLASLDPDLPNSVLPADWPRVEGRRVFTDAFDTLGPIAELRFRQILAEFSTELAELVTHHTSAFSPLSLSGSAE